MTIGTKCKEVTRKVYFTHLKRVDLAFGGSLGRADIFALGSTRLPNLQTALGALLHLRQRVSAVSWSRTDSLLLLPFI